MTDGQHEVSREWDLNELLAYGRLLDRRPPPLDGASVSLWLAGHLLRVRDREGKERPLHANAAQRAFDRSRGRQNIVLKARQMGVTTWVAGHFFLKTITQRGQLSVQVAQTREAAEGIFRMMQRFWECLPAYLREGPLRRGRANVGQMSFPALDSELRVLSAADGSAGRGLTMQTLHCSEVSRWPGDGAATLAGLRAALAPGGEMVIESTPDGAYGCFYEEWMNAGARGSVQHFFPWWMERAYVAAPVTDPTREEMLLMETQGLDRGQIGFRRGLQASYRGLWTQEFAEDAITCFKATGDCCFDIEAVERRSLQAPEPRETRRGGALQIWFPPLADREYIVAVDSAGGGPDGDYAAVEVLELATGLQCAELQQRIGSLELAEVAAALGREYRGATVAVERNNHGAAVLAYLETVHHYPRMYERDGVGGWLTTAANKPGMVSRLGALLLEEPWMFYSRRLLAECRSYISMAGGKTGAAGGAHDDCVMAMAVGQAVRSEMLAKGRRR